MSHLDEGTLHALLDGELDLKEVREIQAHLGSCSACGVRLQSVKDVLAESDRLVGAIQFPGTPRRPAALDPEPEPEPRRAEPPLDQPRYSEEPAYQASEPAGGPAASEPASPRGPRGPERRIDLQPVYDEAPPVLLVPDDNQWGERRRRLLSGMRWAALALVAVGAGYIASEMRRTGGVPAVAPSPSTPPLADESPQPVVSQEETQVAGSDAVPADRASESARSESAKASGAAADQLRQAAPAPPPGAQPAPVPSEQRERTPPEPAPEPTAPAAGGREAAGPEPEARDDAAFEQDEPPAADVRAEAAEALAQLDRERTVERAAAATAALDSAARRRQLTRNAAADARPAPAPAAPAPRTLEQRSAIYLRIGLDEAARQLGRPVHVIEGMQQQFMGLVQGAASRGADPARPVVRVVYQDNLGRMILLDQQRIRPGQEWPAGETSWVLGEIGLALRGEAGPQILRNLRPRVR